MFQGVRYLFSILYLQIEFVYEDGKVVFQDGSSVHADTIFYCTEYESNGSLFIYFSLVALQILSSIPTFIAPPAGSAYSFCHSSSELYLLQVQIPFYIY